MNTEEWKRVDELLLQALELDPQERLKFLDAVGERAPEVRRELDSLLVCEVKADGFLATPALAFSADFFADENGTDARAGRTIGHYQIRREIGRGGMGVVYQAQRSDGQYRKSVAIKVVMNAAGSDEIMTRFHNERQILASLDHPNIARLLDGGTTEDGLSYLVMEYVEGMPITDYCDRNRLATNERLELFRTVCAAVQHAHQNLVIHRDLKPSNIMVTEDGKPKLLDFGIAKVLNPELTALSMERTRTELRVLTPDYASPEQVRGEKLTTASDVYSLGILLYELLTGHRPYRATGALTRELERVICEQEPTKPSTAVNNVEVIKRGETQSQTITPEAVSHARDTQPDKLRRRLSGDLDNIVLMALRKEPKRRYESAAQLSADIGKHMDGLPVIARKDTFKYRATKFAQRNRVGVAAAAIVLLSLIGGIIATVWQARRANEQARIAAHERDRARVEAAKAERINAFLQNILGFSDTNSLSPNLDKKRDATIADALDEASRRAESELAGQPEVLASVRLTIGRAYMVQNRVDDAETHLRAALDIRRSVFGPDHQDTAQAMTVLGELLISKGNYGESESLLREAVAIYQRARGAGNVNEKGFSIALTDHGGVQNYKGESAAAEASLREAMKISANFTGSDRAVIANMYSNLAIARRGQGDLDGAITFQEKSIEEYRRLPGKPSSDTGLGYANLAFYVMMKGDYLRSETLFIEALSIYQETIGETHQTVSYARINLADNYYAQGNYMRAREEIDRAIAIQQKLLPEGHVDYGLSYTVLGKILTRTNDFKGGESYLRRALEARTRALKPGHRWTAETQSALGENLTAQRRYDEAETLLIESHNTLKASLGQQDPRAQEARRRLVALYEAWKKPEMAASFNQDR